MSDGTQRFLVWVGLCIMATALILFAASVLGAF